MQSTGGWLPVRPGGIDPPGGLCDLLPTHGLLGLLLNFVTSTGRGTISPRALQQPVNTSSCPLAIPPSSLCRLMKLIPANHKTHFFFLFCPNLKVLLWPSESLRAGGGFITISSRNGFHISPAVAWAHCGGNCRSSAESDSSIWGHDDTRIKFHPANCESVCFCACHLGSWRRRLSQSARVSTSASSLRTASSCRSSLMSGFIFFSISFFLGVF